MFINLVININLSLSIEIFCTSIINIIWYKIASFTFTCTNK